MRRVEGALGGQGAISGVLQRSAEEARAVRATADGTPASVFLARVAGSTRSQAFLVAEAGLAAGESLRHRGSSGTTASPGWAHYMQLSRAIVIGAVALDLYVGYTALRGRTRLGSDLLRAEDWELEQPARGSARAGRGEGSGGES